MHMLRFLVWFRRSPRLTIELVPSPCWGKNLRALVSPDEWQGIQETVFGHAAGKCQVCGFQGNLHCHEVWRYNEVSGVQTLVGFLALCRFCHEVKHIGRAKVRGRYHQAIAHLARVNRWSKRAAERYADRCFETYERRSGREWRQDVRAVNAALERDGKPPLRQDRGLWTFLRR
jgi:hypothetical protein